MGSIGIDCFGLTLHFKNEYSTGAQIQVFLAILVRSIQGFDFKYDAGTWLVVNDTQPSGKKDLHAISSGG